MFICPRSKTRLIKARAGGATIWYSPETDGRMLNLEMARHFFGPDKTREIWMRSEEAEHSSHNNCPSCQNTMRNTTVPAWIGSMTIDVCRACRIFWLEADRYLQVPLGSELPRRAGDSTQAKDMGEAVIFSHKMAIEKKAEEEKLETELPESPLKRGLMALGLPIEKSSRMKPLWPVVSGILIMAMFFIHYIFGSASLVQEFGFYPGDPARNSFVNLWLSPFLHAGWLHLLGNLYFAYILSDDVEEDLGWKKFLGLHIFTILLISLFQIFFSLGKDLPHVGYSGLVMALLAYYGMQFPKAKLVWMFPASRYRLLSAYQIRVWWVALYYFIMDIIGFFSHELRSRDGISYSSHVIGLIAGYLFWKLFAVKHYHSDEHDVLNDYLNRTLKNPQILAEPKAPKQLR